MPIFMLHNTKSAETKVLNSIRPLWYKIFFMVSCLLSMSIYEYLYVYSHNIFQNCYYGVALFKERLRAAIGFVM